MNRVLFVSSGNNSISGISSIIMNQGESLRQQGIYLDYFPIKGKGVTGYLKNIYLLKQYLRIHEYEIIHAHNGLCGVVSFLSLHRKDSHKLLVSFMGDDLIGENRIDGSYTGLGNIMVSINKWLAEKKLKTVIVKSAQMQKVISRANSIILPNGVDFKQFYPMDKQKTRNRLGIPLEERMILFVADPTRPEKNYRLAKQATVMLSGDSSELRVIQGVPQEALNRYYNAADVCLLTSFHEGSPNVIKEAMACNCPIVSTAVGDVKEVIGTTMGCYITSFEPEDVVEKLKMAFAFRQRTNGRDNIKHLESSIIAKKLIKLYHSAIKPSYSLNKK